MKLQYLASTLSVIALIASSGCGSVYAVTFTPPDKNDAPSQATGGASRGGNLFTPSQDNSSPQQASGGAARTGTYYVNPVAGEIGPAALIALLPQSFYGTTVSERPTIMVYLPISNAKEAIFSI